MKITESRNKREGKFAARRFNLEPQDAGTRRARKREKMEQGELVCTAYDPIKGSITVEYRPRPSKTVRVGKVVCAPYSGLGLELTRTGPDPVQIIIDRLSKEVTKEETK